MICLDMSPAEAFEKAISFPVEIFGRMELLKEIINDRDVSEFLSDMSLAYSLNMPGFSHCTSIIEDDVTIFWMEDIGYSRNEHNQKEDGHDLA